jgi:NTE family protein
MKTIGMALSGGGARGFAHLGILKALYETGIKPTVFSGTSAGAMVGALVAAGYSIETIMEISKNTDFFGIRHVLFGKAGIFSTEPIEKLIKEHVPGDTFESLKHTLIVSATNIIEGETEYFQRGCLSKAVAASSCIPMVYEPVKINDKIYLDGGLLDIFPVNPLIGECDFIIGSYVNEISKKLEHLHMKDMLDRGFHLALSAKVKENAKQCHLFLSPPDMSQYSMFDTDKIDDIIDYGYQYAIKELSAKQDLLTSFL